MEVKYKTKSLERTCCDERQMVKKCGRDVAKRLKLRLFALHAQPNMEAVRRADPKGGWHPLHGDRDGLWAADISRNWRIEVEPHEGGTQITITVIDMVDYH